MLPSGKYLMCTRCGRLFPEGCERQSPMFALCILCEDKVRDEQEQKEEKRKANFDSCWRS